MNNRYFVMDTTISSILDMCRIFEVKNISNRCQKVIAFNGLPLVSQTTIACLVKTRYYYRVQKIPLSHYRIDEM